MAGAKGETSRVIAICGSKDCRTRPGHAALTRDLTSAPVGCQLIESRCLDVCKGPVVVIGFGGDQPVVLRKVRDRKQRRDVVRLLDGEPLSDRLRSIRVTGKRRRTAIARVRPR